MLATANYDTEGRMTVKAPDGTVICRERAVGKPCQLFGDLPFGFPSAWRPRAAATVYLRNRWYSPGLAQFLAPDPEGYVDSYNPYAYGGFDPVNAWDPFGLDAAGFGDRPQQQPQAPAPASNAGSFTAPQNFR